MYELGGAEITSKNDSKKLDEENMVTVFLQLQTIMSRASSGSLLEMDWSKRPGLPEKWNRLKNIAGEVESPEKAGTDKRGLGRREE
ncbi:hypothetical protein L6452_13193 [Arctium lappa]|uniref:Uncharacterized protein n=1 Tax=Arctium lappa TaxID=4217 RepID=A0ACB9CHK8_ARCLA|nr:hypothetical protein L6452_13193 [Arctium lappa]